MAVSSASLMRVFSLGLLALGLILLGSTGYRAFDQYFRVKEQPAHPEPSGTLVSVDSVSYNVSTIIQAHLFGEPKSAKPTVEKAPETQLSLSLIGLLGSSDRSYARALIQVSSGRVKAYSIGDRVENTDATIHSVGDRNVILEREGTYENLIMKRSTVNVAKAVLQAPEDDTRTLPNSDNRGSSVPF